MSNQTEGARQESRAIGWIIFGLFNLSMLLVDAQYWSYVLMAVIVLFGIPSLAGFAAFSALLKTAKMQIDIVHGLILSGLVGAAIISGYSFVVSAIMVLASFLWIRRSNKFAEMREYMPGFSNGVDLVFVVISMLTAAVLTEIVAELRPSNNSLSLFIELAVLYPLALVLGWGWYVLKAGHLANKQSAKRIGDLLHAEGIKPIAKNIKEARATGSDRIAEIDRLAASNFGIDAGLMRASSYAHPFLWIGELGSLSILFIGGGIILNCVCFPAWFFVSVKTHRPVKAQDFVRGAKISR